MALACACRSAPEGSEGGRVVIKTERAPEKPPQRPPEWFDEALSDARARRDRGDLREAIARVQEALGFHPAPEHRAPLLALLAEMHRAVLEMETLAAHMRAAEDPIRFGDPVRVTLVIENVSGREIRLPDRPRGTSGAMLELELVRRDHDVLAQAVETKRRIQRRLGRDLVLAPGESVEVPLVLEDVGNDRPLDGFRTFAVSGVLRPAVLEVDGLARWDPVPIEAAVVRSFRDGWRHLAGDPVARIAQAMEKRAPVHLLTAAALVPQSGRRDAVDALVAALGSDPRFDLALYAALEHLTDLDLGRAPGPWRAWWSRARDRFFADTAVRDPSTPSFD